ncbi:carbamoyl-phosphate synthase L chain, ATP binding domain-containing protein [Phlyctochytrium arcticum]|nr:carbamoyl-phosphate synthase L chain, ATP binding domain-containing protein [Phlyctochytrium arcticum]
MQRPRAPDLGKLPMGTLDADFAYSADYSQSLTNIFGGPGIEAMTLGQPGPLLVANRGEIAIRVIRAAHELGLRAVSIYSHEDRLSMHRYKADESYQIGEPSQYTPVGAYLAMDEIVRIAKEKRVMVIHPGYGFLSENPEFARKVEQAGIAFVGPEPDVIANCGDKTKARELAIRAGVPVVPGTDGPIATVEEATAFVKEHGFPVIIKAAMGGGGRGMRVVRDEQSFASLFERARSEALAAFGDPTVFIERFVDRPRHIEVQLLADGQGNVVHLFERDCSVQRRHQKVVEMGPALNLPDEVRQRILNDAVKLAKAVKYRNAGTAEFLVDQQNRHYFIEINPRIQVEHTVTEEITGVDLVAAQIRIALGASLKDLGLTQDSIQTRGVAIQCRVTTEDPARNFQPDTGRIEVYRSSSGNGVRLDGGPGYSGAVITPHYDSLLVKCTCTGRDFDAARRKTLRALVEFRVRGLKTNIPFLLNLLTHPTFITGGRIWTTFIDDTPELLQRTLNRNRGQKLLTYLGDLVVNGSRVKGQSGYPKLDAPVVVPALPSLSREITAKPAVTGWRNILLEKGPKGFCEAVRAHKGALLMDTTWRDAHQSLLATRVRTIDMARVATITSHALQNAFALECWGGATFDVAMRFLWEDPWDRLLTLRALVPNIPFSMLLRGANAVGYTSYPDNLIYEFCKKARAHGVDIFRVFDSLNYEENLKLGIDAVIKAGGVAEGAISYTGDVSDPSRKKYDLNYYLNLVDRLVKDGIHILGIKDMAGLLKPRAAKMLISAIRERHPNLVIHVHTHDTAGTGVASMLAAYEAGADVVDVAIDSMSGLTSQPSMGAIIGALEGSELDTGISLKDTQALNGYWEQIRLLYSCFDPGLKSGDAGVYIHEMPGGQYTNLLFQSQQLGLGESWNEIKTAYAAANRICGDIVKVTPSSKVVGDLAQFMVSQKLTESDVHDRADSLSFPQSVLEYFQGYLGIPPGGFPEPLRTRILESRRLTRIEGRPGAKMPPLDFVELKRDLEEKFSDGKLRDEDVISSALYPKVYEEFRAVRDQYGDLSTLPTLYFLRPLKVGEEFTFHMEQGKTLYIKLMAIGSLNEATGKRDIYFLLNGEARVIAVTDEQVGQESAGGAARLKNVRPKADPKQKGEIGAPMSGVVVEVRAKVGDEIKQGDPVVVMSAMSKCLLCVLFDLPPTDSALFTEMETVITAPKAGKVVEVCVGQNEALNPGDLVAKIE